MTDFTASNGVAVAFVATRIGQRMTVTDTNPAQADSVMRTERIESWLDPRQVDALREYFRHEEDKRLGRWRWTESPDYVVYAIDDVLTVFDETDGSHQTFSTVGRVRDAASPNNWHRAAAAFLDAHPEPKPWHDAKPDEVWALTLHGKEIAYIRIDDPDIGDWASVSPNEHARFLALNAVGLTAGRRIWPEDAS